MYVPLDHYHDKHNLGHCGQDCSAKSGQQQSLFSKAGVDAELERTQGMGAEISAADSSIFIALAPSLNSLSCHITALSAYVPGSRLAPINQPERCASADIAIQGHSVVPIQVEALPCVFCCDSPCSCHAADVHAPCQSYEFASVDANVASLHALSNMHVLNAPVLHTAHLVSIASDGTHFTSNQINRSFT